MEGGYSTQIQFVENKCISHRCCLTLVFVNNKSNGVAYSFAFPASDCNESKRRATPFAGYTHAYILKMFKEYFKKAESDGLTLLCGV